MDDMMQAGSGDGTPLQGTDLKVTIGANDAGTDAAQTAAGAAGASPRTDEAAAVLHKAEFLDRVSASSNVPRSQVRRIVDATLAELGRALTQDESIALPPFGTAHVRRRRTTRGGEVVLLRLRRNTVASDRRNARPEA